MFYTRLQLTPIHPVKRIFLQIPLFKASNETVFPQIRQSANFDHLFMCWLKKFFMIQRNFMVGGVLEINVRK